MNRTPDFLTIVVPCYNEAGCLGVLLERVELAMEGVPDLVYQILLIDDGTTDATPAVVEEKRKTNSRIGYLRFMRNFGHQAALSAGLLYARGDAIVMMDGDLQHPPELLPQMIERWRSGYDVIQAIRRSQPGLRKSASSRFFYILLNLISDVELQDGAADFRLMSRRAVKSLLDLPEQSRFLRGLVAWLGYPSTTLDYDAAPRHAGRSGYTLRKMIGFAVDAIISLSDRPLNFALYLAGFSLFALSLYVAYVMLQVFQGVELVKGWASTISLLLGIGSVQLFCIGILGLYMKEILKGIRRRPDYLVAQYEPPNLNVPSFDPDRTTEQNPQPIHWHSGSSRVAHSDK